MRRYLFLKLGLALLIYVAVYSRAQVLDETASNDAQDIPENSQDYEAKNKLKVYQGVMGKPGIDFPVLTYIPRTAFTCRGVKSGYYADLETNCQVFHICDEGRKVSFLCPNGTIFQQSDLICDWWYKVDCASSPSLYDESAEQLYEDNRKRKENRRVHLQKIRDKKRDESLNVSEQTDTKVQFINQRTVTENRKNNLRKTVTQNQQDYVSKETQVPSETASFVNTKYSNQFTNQHRHYQAINNYATNKISNTSPKSYADSDRVVTKAPTEFSRGSKTFSTPAPTKTYYKNHRYDDSVITTTQHTIYSPTVPTITVSKLSTRKYVTQPIAKTTQFQPLPTAKPTGFYITREFSNLVSTTPSGISSTKFYPNHKSSDNYFNNPSSIPFTATPPIQVSSRTSKAYNYDDYRNLYTSTVVTTTASPLPTRDTFDRFSYNEFQSQVPTVYPIDDFTAVKSSSVHTSSAQSIVTEKLTKTTAEEKISTSKFNKFTYLPKSGNISTPEPTIPTPYTVYTTPEPIVEHLNSMISTLKDLEGKNISLSDSNLGVRPGLNIPPSAGPNTLHSLAVYFATALDNIVSGNDTNDNDHKTVDTSQSTNDDTTDYISLLSRSTADKYNSLFNVNNESVVESKNESVSQIAKNDDSSLDLRAIIEHDVKNNDLESQQSAGLVNSTPRIRQLAQVFTQALSAFLDDPGTFKKVLEDIRPTEPPNYEQGESTSTFAPTYLSTNEYSSYTREDDEVLDFSDADKSTTYSTTTADPISTIFTRPTESYSTAASTYLPYVSNSSEQTKQSTVPTLNPLAVHLNEGLNISDNKETDYFPDKIDQDLQERFNSKPYGFGVKPENSTPIHTDSDVTEAYKDQSTWSDAIFNITETFEPIAPFVDTLLPPYEPARTQKALNFDNVNEEYLQSAHSQSFISHQNKLNKDYKTTDTYSETTTTDVPNYDTYTSNVTPSETFTTTTNKPDEETTKFTYDYSSTSEYSTSSTVNPVTETTTNSYEYSTQETTTDLSTNTKSIPDNHWSTSPLVTKLWQNTLYVDPLIINRNLGDLQEYNDDKVTSTTEYVEASTPYTTTTEPSDENVIDIKFSTTEDPLDSYSTSSTISTTDETSTITPDLSIHSLLNSTELEIASSQAHQIFGNLNLNQQDMLIEKMKEAESNSTVRRLILLLISTCDSSLNNNKTVQETRNSIISALLDTNDKTDEKLVTSNRSGKSLELQEVDEIPKSETSNDSNSYRFVTSTAILNKIEVPNKTVDVHNVDQDTRALELLRSLYSLAAKWGKK